MLDILQLIQPMFDAVRNIMGLVVNAGFIVNNESEEL